VSSTEDVSQTLAWLCAAVDCFDQSQSLAAPNGYPAQPGDMSFALTVSKCYLVFTTATNPNTYAGELHSWAQGIWGSSTLGVCACPVAHKEQSTYYSTDGTTATREIWMRTNRTNKALVGAPRACIYSTIDMTMQMPISGTVGSQQASLIGSGNGQITPQKSNDNLWIINPSSTAAPTLNFVPFLVAG